MLHFILPVVFFLQQVTPFLLRHAQRVGGGSQLDAVNTVWATLAPANRVNPVA
jgi:hypothetical protein